MGSPCDDERLSTAPCLRLLSLEGSGRSARQPNTGSASQAQVVGLGKVRGVPPTSTHPKKISVFPTILLHLAMMLWVGLVLTFFCL